jgi:hypothetical protein
MYLVVCAALGLAFVSTADARGGWGEPAGGWDVAIEFDDYPNPPSTADLEALDGTWSHDNGSDQWDGSAPGAGNPGGVSIDTVAGAGDGGGDAIVLSLEDTGDPRDDGFADPGSNRKFYFGKDLGPAGASVFDAGVTLLTRLRVNPNPTDAPADGHELHDGGKGHVGIVSTVGTVANVSMAIDTGVLHVVGDNMIEGIADADFQAVWLTAVTVADGIQVDVYLNGSTSAAFSGVVTPGDGSDFADDNYVAVGMGSTGRDGAVQVDYVVVKFAAMAPGVATAVDPAGKAATTWGAIRAAR